MKKEILFSVIIFLCISIGFFGGFYSVDKDLIKETTKQEIEKRLISGKLINPTPDEVYALRDAKVISIDNDFVLVSHPDSQDPLMRIFPYESIKIMVNVNTIIKYFKINENNPYAEEVSKFSDIESGDIIYFARANTDIEGKEEFLAQEIIFKSPNPSENVF